MVRDEFYKALASVLDGEPRVAVIHSSIANLGPPAGTSRWDVLFGLHRLVAEGWTLAFPAFTFSFCSGSPFSASGSASEVGILADWMLTGHRDAKRTPNPIYSFVVVGPGAGALMQCSPATAFGTGSIFDLFEQQNAQIVMLGCGWAFPTQVHRYEELAQVPYRHFKTFEGAADFADGHGQRVVDTCMYVRDLRADARNDFSAVEDRLRQKGAVRSASLWRGCVEAAHVGELADAARGLLEADPYALISNAPAVSYALRQQHEEERQPPLRVAVLGHGNLHMLTQACERRLQQLSPGRRLAFHEIPFGQFEQEILNEHSALNAFKPDVAIFCDRLEDLCGTARIDGLDRSKAEELAAGYAAAILAFHRQHSCWLIVHAFALLYPPNDVQDGETLAGIEAASSALRSALADVKSLTWLHPGVLARDGDSTPVDARLWMLGRFPFSDGFSQRVANVWAGKILSILGKTARVIVIDLDNTLWGGVLGEDGIEGIALGGDFPGNAYQIFQEALVRISRRGLGLAVCSKNDPDLALRAIDTLPAMRFRSQDLVAHRIGWGLKSAGLREIAAELNLSAESLLFIDDNPAECAEVRQNAPEVRVLQLPADPADFVSALLESPWLQAAAVTEEDLRRVGSYQARREIQAAQRSAANPAEFLASLQMKLWLQPLAGGNLMRAAQLCAKTNQFNTTTRRYDAGALQALSAAGADVVVIGLADRMTQRENIGLMVLKPIPEVPDAGCIDLYLLSCRVLGRGLETSVVAWAVWHAARRGWRELRAELIETERNTPVRKVFRDSGFELADNGPTQMWRRTTLDADGKVAPWLTVMDDFS